MLFLDIYKVPRENIQLVASNIKLNIYERDGSSARLLIPRRHDADIELI